MTHDTTANCYFVLNDEFAFHRRGLVPANLPWWWRGVVVNALVVINEVTLRRARLVVLGWVTVCGRVNHLSM